MSTSNYFCRLCLNTLQTNSIIIYEHENLASTLQLFIPWLNLNLWLNPKLCHKCLKDLQFSHYFKQRITANELELKRNLWFNRLNKINFGKCYTCRLCLKGANSSSLTFLYANPFYPYEIMRTVTEIASIEMNFDLVEKPVICKDCWAMVKHIYLFKKNCFEVEEKIKAYFAKQNLQTFHDTDVRFVFEDNIHFANNKVQNNMRIFNKDKSQDEETSNEILETRVELTIENSNHLPRNSDNCVIVINEDQDDSEDDIFNEDVSDMSVSLKDADKFENSTEYHPNNSASSIDVVDTITADNYKLNDSENEDDSFDETISEFESFTHHSPFKDNTLEEYQKATMDLELLTSEMDKQPNEVSVYDRSLLILNEQENENCEGMLILNEEAKSHEELGTMLEEEKSKFSPIDSDIDEDDIFVENASIRFDSESEETISECSDEYIKHPIDKGKSADFIIRDDNFCEKPLLENHILSKRNEFTWERPKIETLMENVKVHFEKEVYVYQNKMINGCDNKMPSINSHCDSNNDKSIFGETNRKHEICKVDINEEIMVKEDIDESPKGICDIYKQFNQPTEDRKPVDLNVAEDNYYETSTFESQVPSRVDCKSHEYHLKKTNSLMESVRFCIQEEVFQSVIGDVSDNMAPCFESYFDGNSYKSIFQQENSKHEFVFEDMLFTEDIIHEEVIIKDEFNEAVQNV